MKWIDRLERRFGRYAVRNLIVYLIIFYAFGYLLMMTNPSFYAEYLSLNAERILHGQVWRIVTYLIYPPSTSPVWLLLLSYIYYSLGRGLEYMWGTFRFNLFLIIGILGNVLAALIIYLVSGSVYLLTADELYLSMLLGYAMTIPDAEFRLYFVIPVKAKWLGIFYAAFVALNFISSSWEGKVMIFMSMLNVILFFLVIRKPGQTVKMAQRRTRYRKEVKMASPKPGHRHRCAVCGRTEEDDPTLEFRYCSRCAGNFEYCQDHLYTHVHVTEDKLQH